MGFWSRLAQTIRPRRHDDDIDEEIAFHLAMRELDGQSPRDARVHFGNPSSIREQMREAGILTSLDAVVRDVRHALRQLRRTPLFTVVAVASLIIGIGTTTALYSVADAVLLRMLPVPKPERLVALKVGHWGDSASVPAYEALRDEGTDVLDGLAAYAVRALTLSEGGAPDRADGAFVSANFFDTMRVMPPIGRGFVSGDQRDIQVVVVSHRFWQQRLGGRASVIGAPLRINGRSFEVVGVAPRGFAGLDVGRHTDLYLPLSAAPAIGAIDPFMMTGHFSTWLRLIGRLQPGVDAAQAADKLSVILQGVMRVACTNWSSARRCRRSADSACWRHEWRWSLPRAASERCFGRVRRRRLQRPASSQRSSCC